MSYNIAMEIFGQCDDARAIRLIAEAAERDDAHFKGRYVADGLDILEHMSGCADKGIAVELLKDCSSLVFEDTRAACQEAGLHYVVSIGPWDGQAYDRAIFYRPGDEEYAIPLDVMNEVVPMREIRVAAERGIEAVFAAIREYDRRTLKDVAREFDVPASAVEAAVAEMDVEEAPEMAY